MKPIIRLSHLLAICLLLTAATPAPVTPDWRAKVDAWVLDTAAQGPTEFIVFLAEQADLSPAAGLTSKLQKGSYVFEQLTATARRTQGPLLAELQRMGVEHRPYWVANMIWVRGDAQTVQALADRPDVAHLYANPQVRLDLPAEPALDSALAPQAIEWNILKVNADDVWAAGYTGQAAVVGGQDTGYDWDHPALINQYRGWDGASADHNYNWHDAIHSGGSTGCPANSPVPCDDDDHGTHTMGTMVGDDGGSNQIGMAPGARWIGCRNMNRGVGTPTTYTECYQWFIAPTDLNNQNPRPDLAPDVINNSWSCPISEGCTNPNVLLTVVNNVRAAGILTVHSAGNSGPQCSTVDEPATIYEASFSVGATDASDNIATFSSRGPVTVDGSNRLKPQVTAPGVSIRSSVRNGVYQSGWSGTSMAAPHVAGLAALLLSAKPVLHGQVDLLESTIEKSALPRTTTQTCGGVPGSSVPNNTYGWGRIDAMAALRSLPFELGLDNTAFPTAVAPDQPITYTLTITNLQPISTTTNVLLTDTLPVGTSFITATLPHTFDGTTVGWSFASLPAGESRFVQLVVQAPGAGTVVNEHYGARSNEAAGVSGAAVSVPVVPYSLEISKTAPRAVLPGEILTYTIAVTNPHPSAIVHNLTLTDTLPAHTSLAGAQPPATLNAGILTWDLGQLAPGATWMVKLGVHVLPEYIGDIANDSYAVSSNEVPQAVFGSPVSTLSGNPILLPVILRGLSP